ncbi:MAG: ribosome hibernation promoting factor [Oceanospirillales bacterium]|uniref:Ribosome hibernation promoting factor n=1 Tax=Marinobacterium halophilum TaxID=267374 RepID=A0A2P8EYQ5_9GAMM|nr:ribosome hibernation promoting factor [Marinobacterium halophilum]MBR9827218.1 ribosome hibernation promoting factor [Oceanospirillales bacterium]PSL14592.1 putative sigma-54 modulation protein [Marinobacterium halophilum]
MQINITGHHVELTDALNEYVRTKFDRLERHFDNITNAQVTLSVEKQRQKAEADIHLAGGEVFASNEHDDMYAAIDGMVDKLDRQIIKHKEKMKSHK